MEEDDTDIAVMEAHVDYTEIAVAARPVAPNTVEEAEAMVDKAVVDTVVAILEGVDLLFFAPSVRLAHSSYQP